MVVKQYSNDKVLQAIYSKTIKRMEGAEQKFGVERVISNINKNWYWISYKNPKNGDDYYNTERGLVDDKGAYAAIQQAMIDFRNHLNIEEDESSNGISEEEKTKILRKEWMQWVGAGWAEVISRRMPITSFNNVGIEFMGKVRKLGDLEAWGYKPYGDDLRACMKFAYDRFINKVFKWIDNPGPNITRWTMDNQANIYCLDKLYVSGEDMEPYVNLYLDNNLDIVKKFEKAEVQYATTPNNTKENFDECFLTDDEVFGK